ncbi:hypothetical protein B0H13DRAFT_2268381 [Mycena leptocephala]|nr:hypothetical protein B0H13DRAFT_2268381 [Mycena leptocephala]
MSTVDLPLVQAASGSFWLILHAQQLLLGNANPSISDARRDATPSGLKFEFFPILTTANAVDKALGELMISGGNCAPSLIERGGAYGSMALLEPIPSYLATGDFPDADCCQIHGTAWRSYFETIKF